MQCFPLFYSAPEVTFVVLVGMVIVGDKEFAAEAKQMHGSQDD